MVKITKGWPKSRRRGQAARCRRARPWTKSTGPRTDQGKAAVAGNAHKHGFRGRDMAELKCLLRKQRRFVVEALGQGALKNFQLPRAKPLIRVDIRKRNLT
ncbi:MAG: hypothetical protein K9G62_05580 [Alphaproteobacteria bacterium]|nr:hypothetical protein [Alphaproteobacteria bacterium]